MAVRRTDVEWESIFVKWDNSKLSQEKFCLKEGISKSTFWMKLSKRKASKKGKPSKYNDNPLFIPIRPAKSIENCVYIQSGQVIIKLPISTNPKVIGEIISHIEIQK